MSQTRIICEGCGFPRVYCRCNANEAESKATDKFVDSINASYRKWLRIGKYDLGQDPAKGEEKDNEDGKLKD